MGYITHVVQCSRHYDNGAVAFRVFCDGTYLTSCVDAAPITQRGAYILLRTDNTSMQFDDVKVERRTKYFQFGGQTIAMRKGRQLLYLHQDHLGSTLLAT